MSKYKRKSERSLKFTAEILQEARERIDRGESKRSVAASLGVNECSLRKRLKVGTVPATLGRFVPVFSPIVEEDLANHIRELDKRFYGLTVRDVMLLAFQYAEMNNFSHRFNKDKKTAGRNWTRAFAKRNNLSLRSPEKCSLARAVGFNRVQFRRFFDNLRDCYSKTKAGPHRIFNMDETGMSTVPNKIPKVFAPKGKRNVSKVVSAERGQTVTAVCCMSASGIWVPPCLIFPRKRMRDELFVGAPPGTLRLVAESGYMNTDLFLEWLHHFQNFVKSSAEDPVILILDNHTSHCSLPAIIFAREHRITLLTLPPHASHKMQPLDKGFFGPLKSAFSAECDKWIVNNPGKVITLKQISSLFHNAYSRAATIGICEKSFAATGLYPYNPDIFTDDDFAPAQVTDVLLEENVDQTPDISVPAASSNTPQSNSSSDEDDNLPLRVLHPLHTPPRNDIPVVENLPSMCPNESAYYCPLKRPNSPVAGPSHSSISNMGTCSLSTVTPEMIVPLPKIKEPQVRRKHGKKSEILSSTPYKDQLEESLAERTKQVKRSVFSDKSTCKNPKKSRGKKEDKDAVCPSCKESYSSTTKGSDWLQCAKCKKWWHEDCSNYLGQGIFTCNGCIDEKQL